MMDFINPFLQWLNQHPNWAALGTFIISAAESVAIIGTIVPGTIMMTAIGTLAGAGVIPLFPTLIAAILGAIVGDGISYLLGHYFKDRIRLMWPFRSNPGWLEKGETFFHKHGGKSVFIGRFVGPVRAIIPLIAGMLSMRPLRFYIANITSAIGWAPAYMLPGILMGAISLELPPDIAVHAILVLFLVTLFIILCIWMTFKIFFYIGYRIDHTLNIFWKKLQNSRYAHSITVLLKHYNPYKTHGQLVLAFYFVIVISLLVYLGYDILAHASSTNFFNNTLYHFFRSIRSPLSDQVSLYFTLLGEKYVIVPVMLIISAWLFFTKRTRLALHLLVLTILATLSIEWIKHLVHSQRPWGIQLSTQSYSFPSGHATLATVFYLSLALFISQIYPSKRRYLISISLLIILLISLSRLYLGAHWFTDILAGWLLGSALIMLIIISYNRQNDQQYDYGKIVKLTLITLLCVYSFNYFSSINYYKKQYRIIDYPYTFLSMENWWKQSDKHIPIYRINRFGLATQVLNLQWIGHINEIEKTLLENEWELPPDRDWISIILRITDIESSETLPLVSPIHLDKKPVLVLIKYTEEDKSVMVLRIWDSHIFVQQAPLWVGTVSLIPRTYNWLFKKKSDEIAVNPTLIFSKNLPKNDVMKLISLSPSQIVRKHKIQPVILLIKPKA